MASDKKAQILQQQGQGFAQLQSVSGGIGKQESALSSSKSSLDSSAASRAFSFHSRSVSCLDSIALICASIVGCQFNLANQRRQGGKEERNSDLLINRDAEMGGDVDMAVGGEERDQDDQGAGQQGSQAGSIQPRDWLFSSETVALCNHGSEPKTKAALRWYVRTSGDGIRGIADVWFPQGWPQP